ncbi:MAG: hypothetical protein L6N95_00255 [Candidatus Methylarchaceae archaeon HK01B]|nr:hypothetical protein [Candidatus Methylarchaceae archaeon HK01B]
MYGIPSPFRILESVTEEYKEEDLVIKNFSLVKLMVFDMGCVADFKLDSMKICESMVHSGFAAASEALDDIHGKEEYLARRLNIVDEEIKTLWRSLKEEDRKKADTKITNYLESIPKIKVREFEKKYIALTSLLNMYLTWDRDQIPDYAERGIFSRAILYPILIKFESMDKFRAVRIVISVYKSGVGCIGFWLFPADQELKVDEMIDLVRPANEIEVEIALPVNLREAIKVDRLDDLIEEAKKYVKIDFKRKEELDKEANQNKIAKEFDITYTCYHCNFSDLSMIYKFLVHALYLDYLGKKRNLENFNILEKASPYQRNLLILYEFPKDIKDPFEQIVKIHPRQILALIANNKEFKTRTPSIVRKDLVDLSPSLELSRLFSSNAMLLICSSKIWEDIKNKSKNILMTPRLDEISKDFVNFEILYHLRMLTEIYDSFLAELLSKEEVGMDKLVDAEKMVTYSLEEAKSLIHIVLDPTRSFWSFAEEKLGIKKLNKALEKKLSMVRRSIAKKRYDEYLKIQTDLANKMEKEGKSTDVLVSEISKIGERMKDFIFFIAALTFVSILNQVILGDWRIALVIFILVPFVWLLLLHRESASKFLSKLR